VNSNAEIKHSALKAKDSAWLFNDSSRQT